MADNRYEQRRVEFGRAYQDFEGSEIVRLIEKTGDWLALLLMDEAAVAAAMLALHRHVFPHDPVPTPGVDWRELWANSDFLEPLAAQFMVSLNAFAFWGLRPDLEFFGTDGSGDEVVAAYVRRGRDLLDAIPAGWSDTTELSRTVLAAEARLRLDTERGVSPEQLAALARISLKSIKNMLTPKAGATTALRIDGQGEIPRADAIRWLEARSDFQPSLWRDAEAAEGLADDPGEDLGEVLFVPVAKDGTWFDPVRCRNGTGYRIGPKGAESRVSDYRAALDRLTRMARPHWRRPNAAGHWGLVVGVDWMRKSAAELFAGGGEGA